MSQKEQGSIHFLRKNFYQVEEGLLHRNAAHSKDHTRRMSEEEDYRLPYRKDVDRIVHSKAYARYSDKTQVAYLIDNDHITHRGLHVQLVSHFARGIAAILQLNGDLVEAIALGHDVGHPPFGHEGEEYLSELSQEHLGRPFAHPEQSCRLFSQIEPLNLGLAVYDGILCHDGGMAQVSISPNYHKNWQDHMEERTKKGKDPHFYPVPASLEGALVKICDTVSYLGRDLEDAIRLGLIERSEVPITVLGIYNQEILDTVASNLIENSYEKGEITLSAEVLDSLVKVRLFNFERIYQHPKLKVESEKIKRGYRILFEELKKQWIQQGNKSLLWKRFVYNKSDVYQQKCQPEEWIVDFISGMTDQYFVRTLEDLTVPKKIILQ